MINGLVIKLTKCYIYILFTKQADRRILFSCHLVSSLPCSLRKLSLRNLSNITNEYKSRGGVRENIAQVWKIRALIFPIICIAFYPTHLSPISFFLHTQLLMVKHLLARNVWMSCPSSLSGIPSVPPSQGYPCLFQAESLFSQEQTMGQSVDGIYTFFMRINLYFPLLYCFLWLTDPGCLIDRHWLFNRPT